MVGRGARKDFIDLYALCQRIWTTDSLLAAAQERAPGLYPALVLRSRTCFEDGGREPLPRMREPLAGPNVVRFLRDHVGAYVHRDLLRDR